jgi:hypothetical protein
MAFLAPMLPSTAMRMLDLLRVQGSSSRRVHPHAGRRMSLNLAAGLGLGGNVSYPRVFQPFGGLADDMAYRWFCHLGLKGNVPEHSIFSKNRQIEL